MNTLSSSVFIPLEIASRKKAHTYVTKASDDYAMTPLSKLLVKAHILQQRLLESPGMSQKEFCELKKSRHAIVAVFCNSTFLALK